jgi:hypothetical protein
MLLVDYFAQLDQSTQDTIAAARQFSSTTINGKTGGCWSPLQVLEHCWLTEKMVIAFLHRPSAEMHDQETVHGNSKLHHLVVNKRDIKLQAPDRLQPTGAITSCADFESKFASLRQGLHDSLEGGTLIVDNRVYPHPVLGILTVTDWLYFLIHHTQRHIEQLHERVATV